MAMSRLLAIALITLPATVWACGAAGPNAHVGPVLSVDEAAGTFTVRDAETQSPITFDAGDALLERARRAEGPVTVKFEKQDHGGLRATALR